MSSFTENKNKPSSFSTICTYDCFQELIGLLFSLSIYHTNEKIYIMCDTKTKEEYDKISMKPKLKIIWFQELDKYSELNRAQMEKMNIWSNFQMNKSIILDYALKNENDSLFLDSDIIITDIINDIQYDMDIGVSPGFVKKDIVLKYGYYNGGMLWVKNKNIPKQWREFTKKSRFYDQASIEDLYKYYKKINKVFIFQDNYNLQSWRFILNDEPIQKICSYVKSDPTKKIIYYKDKPLKCIHTHFNKPEFKGINNFLIEKLKDAKMFKILLSIYRCIDNKWTISIPKQPMNGLGIHNNDSFRELPMLMKENNYDVDVMYHNDSIHCKIFPNIILYDRPTLQWFNSEIEKSSLLLLGNGDINIEGKIIQNKIPCLPIKSWIFWPRRPQLVEQLLEKYSILSYDKREIESIFIGNFENNVQEKYRTNPNNSWESVLTEYHCTKGQKHKFSHEEYLMKLRNSRYGLCLRGYGSKCHREVELMAFGTIPIVTHEVTMHSYMDPPIENVHYIRVKNTQEFKEKLQKMNEKKWKIMSRLCYEWYQRNVHSKNCWKNMIEHILYDEK